MIILLHHIMALINMLNTENDRWNPKFEVLCQSIAYLHIPADQILMSFF